MIKKRYVRTALLASACIAALGLIGGVSPAAAKKVKKKTVTKTATFSSCVSGAAAIPDDPNLDTDPVGAGALALPVTVPNFKGGPQDGVVTSFVSAGVRITHTFAGDLRLFLASPGGKVVTLAQNRGGSGHGFGTGAPNCSGSPVLFSDSFATPISTPGNTGDNPISGSFKPEQPLAAFVGGPARGAWTLIAVDTSSSDVGTIDALSLNFTYNYLAQVKKKGKKK